MKVISIFYLVKYVKANMKMILETIQCLTYLTILAIIPVVFTIAGGIFDVKNRDSGNIRYDIPSTAGFIAGILLDIGVLTTGVMPILFKHLLIISGLLLFLNSGVDVLKFIKVGPNIDWQFYKRKE